MKNRKLYIASIIFAMLVASIGTASCGNKEDTGNSQKQTSEHKQTSNESGEDKKTSEVGGSNKTESNTGSTTSTASNTEAKGEDSEELDLENMTPEDLVKDLIDKESLTAEEVFWLDSTFRFAKFDEELNLLNEVGYKAFSLLDDKGVKYEITQEHIERLLKSEYPQLRVRGMEHTFSLFGLTEENEGLIKELIKNEQDPAVIRKAVQSLGNNGNDPEVGAFLISAAKHENPHVRDMAACWIASSWNDKMEGAVETELELMKDEEDFVAKTACKASGQLRDKRILKALEEILNDDEKYEMHGDCMVSVIHMWLDYPSHKETDKEAYKVTMDYLKKKPRNNNVPSWITVSDMAHVNKQHFDDWKKKAKYHDSKEIADVMTEIIKDKDANSLLRCGAVKVVAEHCGKKAFKDLKPIIKKLKDKEAERIMYEYTSKEKDFK